MLLAEVAQPWAFRAHPDVWGLVGALVVGYWAALKYLGPHLAGDRPIVTRRQRAFFSVGVGLLWLNSDWPMHDLADEYLFSMHMVQHTLFSLVIPPILLLGTPTWLLEWALGPVMPAVRRLARPLPAALMFNGVVAISHWPTWVDVTLRVPAAHFGAHLLLVTVSLLMWLPVVNSDPALPTMSPPVKMLYLFLQGLVPTVPASFLAFADGVIYDFYAGVPRLWGLSAVEDQQIAGAIMKVGGTMILWSVIIGVFFRWYARSQRDQGDVLTWDDVQRDFDRTKPAVP